MAIDYMLPHDLDDQFGLGAEHADDIVTLMGANVCAVSHYVKHLDEAQTIAEYDYHWCGTHGCICDPDGCRWGDGCVSVPTDNG